MEESSNELLTSIYRKPTKQKILKMCHFPRIEKKFRSFDTDSALAPLDEFPRIFLKNEGNSSSRPETRNSVLSQSVIREKKRTVSSRNSITLEGNDLRNFLVEPKQEILKMFHFLRFERKF